MSLEMAEAIRQLTEEGGYTKESVKHIIEDALISAYKRKFGTSDNAVVRFNDDLTDVSLYSRKVIVDGVYDPVVEMELEDALKLSPDCEVGDEIEILVDPHEFDRGSVQTGKQTAQQSFRNFQKDSLYAEFKDKVGEVIIGYYQRERNGNIYVNLGRSQNDTSNIEGVLPKKFQSPRETYKKGDRIKAIIEEVKKTNAGAQIVLSRTSSSFVRKIIEVEVPEIYDKTVEIQNIVREPGYRTKVAVYSNREDVDPVGACVGLKGVRIQNVIRELEGEKVDVLKYDKDPRVFIANALSPAEVSAVIILDETKRSALAVVNESQFSLAIGKQGLNVRLANRLVDWSIDVKTEDQCEEIEKITAESRKAAESLFNDASQEEPDIENIADLPGVDIHVAELLKAAGIERIEDYLDAVDSGKIASVDGVSAEDNDKLQKIIDSVCEIIDEPAESENAEAAQGSAGSDAAEDEEQIEFECPECGARVTEDMTVCPNCGVELSFEYEEEE
ncbi:MAG: transcription termination/antitermination protein NusA [Spirochaetaceae bacterium]|nr:transcription termination/antitermination protein NusA [Spirochaetaceae bacterium]MDD6485952.1 transcription termination factor NusA [Spirochaetales bacterium]